MGDYLPTTRYLKAAEPLPCRARTVSTGPALGLPASTPKRACTSRRRFTIRLPRSLRSAVVTVAGRRIATLRGKRLRARVSLRGLPRGRYQVRISGRTRTGRRTLTVRTYRTCVGRRATS